MKRLPGRRGRELLIVVWRPGARPVLAGVGRGPAERRRLRAMRSPRAARQSAAAVLLARFVLGAVLGARPDRLRMSRDGMGRPLVAGGPDFNLSHCGPWVAIAVAAGRGRTGIDVEAIDPDRDLGLLAARVLADGERHALAGVPPRARARRFFLLWALKEAWLKGIGSGIGGGMARCRFDLDGAAPRGRRVGGDDGRRWHFGAGLLDAGHVLAWAARPGPVRPHLLELHARGPRPVLRRIRLREALAGR